MLGQLRAEIPNSRILWTNGDLTYVARGMRFWTVGSNGQKNRESTVLGSRLERAVSFFRVSRQTLRLGIHHLWPLPDGAFLVVARKRVFRIEPRSGECRLVFRFPRGNKPAHRGVCVTGDGHVFMGEYVMNMDRTQPIALYRSMDHGNTFSPVLTFVPGEIRHIHFVQWDPVESALWMGTGDADPECRLYKSTDHGDTWDLIGGGSQLWRAVCVAFRPEALYWGTDAGSDSGRHPNYIVRLDRNSRTLQTLRGIQGPCHGSSTLRDGTIVLSTGVEGGANEEDGCAHLWMSRDGSAWSEVASYRKDRLPFLVQYGVLRFPPGLEMSSLLAFTGMGLAGAGEKAFFYSESP